ncbi:acyl transferase [Lewinellaceae bacterium SD302]|nr:acyl transferase [Lewinellaceae bacterium SD302]
MLPRIENVDATTFAALSLEVFRYQAVHNPIYAEFLKLLHVNPLDVGRAADIPCLPIALFKKYDLRSGGEWSPVRTFTSSGTTGQTTSRHLLRNESWYRQNARRAFEAQYGSLINRPILALLPGYLERSGSSLVFMADDFIKQSNHTDSGFFLDDQKTLHKKLSRLQNETGPAPLLIGVSFALLDLADKFPGHFSRCIIMETGGMKGRRREMTRTELHDVLKSAFQTDYIHSEYGMTELLSQAYAPRDGFFQPAPTLRAFTRETSDPLTLRKDSKTGALNLHDLANLDTISFISTDDLGRVYPDGAFEVLGRMDASDTRGCNLLY